MLIACSMTYANASCLIEYRVAPMNVFLETSCGPPKISCWAVVWKPLLEIIALPSAKFQGLQLCVEEVGATLPLCVVTTPSHKSSMFQLQVCLCVSSRSVF